MGCSATENDQTVGYVALVAYIPDPLARFLDDLRIELTPSSKPRAHVTILPPRPHDDVVDETIVRLASDARSFQPFRVEIGAVEVFAASNVVYLGLAAGAGEFSCLYGALNRGSLEFRESFPYHPHVTLAQDIQPGATQSLAALARKRWADYQGPCDFVVDHLSFVEHSAPALWVDLATIGLGAFEAVSR